MLLMMMRLPWLWYTQNWFVRLRLQIKYHIYWMTVHFLINNIKWWEHVKFAVGIKFHNCVHASVFRFVWTRTRVDKDEGSIQHNSKIHWHNRHRQRIRSNVHRMHFHQIMRVANSKGTLPLEIYANIWMALETIERLLFGILLEKVLNIFSFISPIENTQTHVQA